MSISALMKCTAVIRQFAYGSTSDEFDEYLQMSEQTERDALFFFNMCIIELYMPKYLRNPTSEDVCHDKVNTVGVIKKDPTIMLEAVASQDLWIWHAFFGIAGANNDINVLDNSPLFDDLLDDLAPVVPYVVNGVEYRNGYYLADGIYPEWESFVKSFTVATDPKHTHFKQHQESARKNVERAFGVLQGRWGLIQQPARAYEVNTLRRIMYAGNIMHNMILEDQNMSIVDLNHVYSNPARSMQTMWIDRCETQRRKAKELRDRYTHISLQQNLMNHIWREVEEASEED
nr:protein ALP1-like isoform X1 [Tanacetum cinerariifolium]